MLELAILGLLIESPMHGYELRKRLTGLLGAFRAFSYGSLYPALRRMQADGLIAENAAPAGTPVRRARRVYQLTDAGRRRFAELVADTGYIWRSSTALRQRRGCASWKAAAVRSRNAEKVYVKRWRGPATRLIGTPASCINSGSSPANVKSSGSTSSSPPNGQCSPAPNRRKPQHDPCTNPARKNTQGTRDRKL
jgi:DNA-binding PadR family transcriptional regulator